MGTPNNAQFQVVISTTAINILDDTMHGMDASMVHVRKLEKLDNLLIVTGLLALEGVTRPQGRAVHGSAGSKILIRARVPRLIKRQSPNQGVEHTCSPIT